ncbi:hypothetical protein [Actinophytocola glycyrrhizae]|uniref:PPE family protein n=1 Tax=Actinophytocola glycyrrhizae TaxID=2044873 RepID=A0ABV9SCI5_9PSEU
MTPQRIYEELTTGPGSETLQAAQHVSSAESAAEQARAERIRRLLATIESGWRGSAADGAQGAALPLARHAAEGAEYLHIAQDLLDRQAGSFHRAAADVEPMPPEPAADLLDQVVPFDVDTDAQTQAYQQKAQHNIRVFEGYDNASNHNETHLPRQFSSTTHSGGGISVTPADTVAVDDTPRNAGPDDVTRDQASVDGTAPSGHRPAPGPVVTAPAEDGVAGGNLDGNPGQVGRPGIRVGGPGGRVESGVPGAPGGRGGGFGGGPGGLGGSGTSGGSGGQGSAGGSGSVGGPGASRGPVLGPGSGAGAGASAADEAAARRGVAGAAGRGGGTGPVGAPLGAGRNKDEDQEYERKVLIEGDPDGMFGSDALTAPQVIGDDEYED